MCDGVRRSKRLGQRVDGSVRRSKRVAELMGGGHSTERGHDVKRGKHGIVCTSQHEGGKSPHECVLTCGGVSRSKRLAELMEGDTEHAHKRKRHEGVSRVVYDTVEPWRDK